MTPIVNIEQLRARAAQERVFFDHMDRIVAALSITVDAVARMRREVPNITPAEIAKSLAFAADEIAADPSSSNRLRLAGEGIRLVHTNPDEAF
jgi:hypothetical protein